MAHELPDALRVFAERYRESQAGRTGIGASDFTLDYQKFLKAAHATTAEARMHIEQQLRQAAASSGGHFVIETHPRDENILLMLRLKRDGGEVWLFQHLGEPSPTQERRQLASVFAEAQNAALPERWQTAWQPWCSALANKAECGDSIAPFQRSDPAATRELMQVLVHFGDTDPAGFDILRDLRARTARPIQPLHMAYRPRPDSPTLSADEKNQLTRLLADPTMTDCREPLEAMRKAGTKGEFEQESLGPPELEGWPFYALRV